MQLGFELALMGMATVFSFLILLILFTTIMSKLVNVFEKRDFQTSDELSENTRRGRMPDEILTAVIQAAVQKHRAQRRKA